MLSLKSALSIAVVASASLTAHAQATGPAAPTAPPSRMMLVSRAISDGGTIPNMYSCTAGASETQPAITWSEIPANAQELVLLLHDPDAHPNMGVEDNMHWLVWGIKPTATGWPEGKATRTSMLPGGAMQAKLSNGNFGYRGPCPPIGSVPHHYLFELFAVDTKLSLPETATRKDVMGAMDGHVIGHASLAANFSR